MYYPDLSPYTYLDRAEPDTYTIGWLDAANPYVTGQTPEEVRKRLIRLCTSPTNRTRGYHKCPFCDDEYPVRVNTNGRRVALGDGEIRLEGASGKRYAAPNLVCHYVDKHNYSPPEEFQRAVLNSKYDPMPGEGILQSVKRPHLVLYDYGQVVYGHTSWPDRVE